MRELREQKRILFTGGLLFVFGIIVLLTTNVAVTQTENMPVENAPPSQPLPLPPLNTPQPTQPQCCIIKSTAPILFDRVGDFLGGDLVNINLGLAPINGTLKNLTVWTAAAPGEGASETIVVYKTKDIKDPNTVEKTLLTCTITGSSQMCTDNVHSVTVTQGDLIRISIALSADAQENTEFSGGLGFQEN